MQYSLRNVHKNEIFVVTWNDEAMTLLTTEWLDDTMTSGSSTGSLWPTSTVDNHQLSSLLPLKPSSQVRHDYDTRLRQRISMLTFFDSSQSVVACCSQSQSSRLMTSVGASSHLVENVAAKTVWFCDRDHHHHHHIRFWYLRCCGCPGLRGRSTIEYYHNEWVLWDVHNMNCMKLEVKAAAWQVSIYMYVYLAQYQHRD